MKMFYGKINIKMYTIMDLNEFVEKFAEQFDETPVEEFKAETEFKAIEEWGSLTALTIIAMVDEEFDVTIKGEEIRAAETIEELFSIIKEKA